MSVGRRRARRDALFILYQADLMGVAAEPSLLRAERSGMLVDVYTRRLVLGAWASRRELDTELQKHLRGWTLDRLAPLERNILRIAAFELREDSDVPASVAIDEAVGLAKRYCSNEAGALVNGVLAALDSEVASDRSGDAGGRNSGAGVHSGGNAEQDGNVY